MSTIEPDLRAGVTASRIECEDSLRALSIAETADWAKIPGLPEGAPRHAVCQLWKEWEGDPKGLRAIMCRIYVEKLDKHCYDVIPFTVVEASKIELVKH